MTTDAPITVLLVDDEPLVLGALGLALRRTPWRILTARSGDEALQVCRTTWVDVVITDQHMPGMTGIDLLERLADARPEVMRILLTGNYQPETVTRAIRIGAVYRYLTKPVSPRYLSRVVSQAISEGQEGFRHAAASP